MNTDRLEGLVQAAGPLLRRADEVLTAGGAPPEHRVWAELRRVRLLPSDAVNAVAALRPQELADTVPELRRQARACTTVATDLPPPHTWRGEAAEAYETQRRRAADAADSLDERLSASADLADAVAGWMSRTRAQTAAVLADVLTSVEAVQLASAEPSVLPQVAETRAAAAMAAQVLRTVADSYESAGELLASSRPLAG